MPGRKHTIHNSKESFYIGVFQDNYTKSIWHYHADYELSFVTEGVGQRIVGDSMEDFNPGDLIFLGSQLPHVWIPKKEKLDPGSEKNLELVFVLFDRKVLLSELLILPEFKYVKKALNLSQRGLHITGETRNKVSEIMLRLPYESSFKKLNLLYEILDAIGKSPTPNFLASKNYLDSRFISNSKRINKVHEYMMENYQRVITLKELADLVHMAISSLCRYFKAETGYTISEYLNKIRIDYARRLLMNPDLSVLNICFDCGFNNLSHFNKQFRRHTNLTPTSYKKKMLI